MAEVTRNAEKTDTVALPSGAYQANASAVHFTPGARTASVAATGQEVTAWKSR